MTVPRWTDALLRRLAPADRVEDVLGDLEEGHRRRVARRARWVASVLTGVEALEIALALLRARDRRGGRDDLGLSTLDFKLGVRMLVRYPGLTVVGGVAIAFAIWVGAGFFELTGLVTHPDLRLPGSDRLVGVRMIDVESGRIEPHVVHDMMAWREGSSALVDWGAYRTSSRSLIVGEGPGEPATVAEITGTGFTVAGVRPLLGRALTPADEAAGAPTVAVIGHDVWRARFAGDPGVLGRTIRLSGVPATVVGVMPEGFGFPLAHRIWIPLRTDPLGYDWRQGPVVQVFARLAPGATLSAARAELAALGARIAAAHPATHARLRVEVLPFGRAALNMAPAAQNEISFALASSNVALLALIALICSNVALLMFARAAARQAELIVRSALGASRRRIVGQLFAEALVLGAVGALGGLAATRAGLRWALDLIESQVARFGQGLPFWFEDRISGWTILYAVVLTVLSAVLAGVVPAVKITRGLGAQLRQSSAGGGGVQFGGIWSAVIVAQVALTVAFPAVSFYVRQDADAVRATPLVVDSERYLAARLEMDREPLSASVDTSAAAFRARFRAAREDLERALLAEPDVVDVTFAGRLPRMYHPWHQVEVEGGAVPPPDPRGHRMGAASIDVDYFDVLDAPLVAGRAFGSGDLTSDARVAIVNQTFVDSVLGGRNPLGERIRIAASEDSRRPDPSAPWIEIVGVASDLGTTSGYGEAGIYLPEPPESSDPVHMVLRVRGDPLAFAPKLLGLATRIDPTLRLHDVIRLDDTIRDDLRFYRFWFRMSLLVSALALLLSLTGIYSVMAFTVARRTREIGIRVALGSRHARVLGSILLRPLAQVGTGIALGIGFVTFMTAGFEGWTLGPLQAAMVAGYALLMAAVCGLACIVPTRRALRVEPTEALRADG